VLPLPISNVLKQTAIDTHYLNVLETMNRDLQRLDNKIKQLERNNAKLRNNIKMYEIKVGKLRQEISNNINEKGLIQDNNDRL
jgi:predicted RNase H-like nuclease (RuvC/YqgF family)